MPDDPAELEQAAESENDWVRARIVKREVPAEGTLLKIAERARNMAANSLGNRHPAYAVALQNLGLYYEIIENDRSRADTLFAEAREILKDGHVPLAYGFHCLGLYHGQVTHDDARGKAMFDEARAILLGDEGAPDSN